MPTANPFMLSYYHIQHRLDLNTFFLHKFCSMLIKQDLAGHHSQKIEKMRPWDSGQIFKTQLYQFTVIQTDDTVVYWTTLQNTFLHTFSTWYSSGKSMTSDSQKIKNWEFEYLGQIFEIASELLTQQKYWWHKYYAFYPARGPRFCFSFLLSLGFPLFSLIQGKPTDRPTLVSKKNQWPQPEPRSKSNSKLTTLLGMTLICSVWPCCLANGPWPLAKGQRPFQARRACSLRAGADSLYVLGSPEANGFRQRA